MRTFTEDDIFQSWSEYLTSHHASIGEVADAFPQRRSFTVDYEDLLFKSPDLSEILIEDPEHIIRVGESAIQGQLAPDQKVGLNLRITNLPTGCRRQIKDFDVMDLGKMVEFPEVLVKKITGVKPRCLSAVFRCSSCGWKQSIPQDEMHRTEPLECPKDDGGCGKRANTTSFKFMLRESTFINSQKAEIIDPQDTLQGATQPRSATIFLLDDLVNTFYPGDRIKLVAIWKGRDRGTRDSKSVDLDIVLEAISIQNSSTRADLIVTDEDRVKFEEIKKDNPLELIVRSIAPSIHGYVDVKTALALSLFGGVSQTNPDGSRNRGDLHILMVGDPGTAKSKLLEAIVKFSSRGFFVNGASSTGKTLTAAVTAKDADFGEGKMTIEAGPFVLADQGILAIDEIDKMSKADQEQFYGPMEKQVVEIAKGGIMATFKSRCTVIAAANPKTGKFNRTGWTIAEQFDIHPPLISRFALVIAIEDRPNEKTDTLIGNRIGLNMFGIHDDLSIPPYDLTIWKKYIQEYKQLSLSDTKREVIDYITTLYVKIRKSSQDGGRMISPRQCEDIIRLSQASARAHGRNEVLTPDVDLAEMMIRGSSSVSTGAASGTWGDLSEVYTQVKRERMGQLEKFIDIVRPFTSETISHIDLTQELRKYGIEDPDKMIRKFLDKGDITEPYNGQYRYVGVEA